jgi:DNA modification methylase
MTTRILVGHVLDVLKTMEDESVHCVITSVPYYGLRSYGTEPQIWGGRPDCQHVWKPLGKRGGPAAKQGINSHLRGRSVPEQQTKAAHADLGACCERCLAWRGEHGQEPTFDLWLQHEVLIFRAIRRVIRKDACVFVNCGDAYATTPNGRSAEDTKAAGSDNRTFRDKPVSTIGGIFKAKDRLLMPHRLAIALHEDGWWVRDEIVWHKLNSMPSSAKDRTCPSHEFMFMLTKKPHYYYDYVAIQEPLAEATINDRVDGDRFRPDRGFPSEQPSAGNGRLADNGMKIKRSVWSLPLEPFPDAHFATMPTKLITPAIEAGTSAHGVCPKCGAPWERVTESKFVPQPDVSAERGIKGADGQKPMDETSGWDGFPRGTTQHVTTGWQPTCKHAHLKPVPATILDPFGGSGTTGLVADMLGRDAILIELNPTYAQMARKRIRENLGRVQSDIPEDKPADLPLFQSAAE